MLKEKQIIDKKLTIFHLPEQDDLGRWKVWVTRGLTMVKVTYALNKEQADIIRGQWINRFWGGQLN